MKVTQTWKRNTPSTISGESITTTTTYYSFNKDEIDAIEKQMPAGILTADCKTMNIIPTWLEADHLPSSASFLCPHCREKVYYHHGSTSKTSRRGLTKRCLYKFCPWCGLEVTPLRINYLEE